MAKEISKRCLGCMSEIDGSADKCPHCGFSPKSEYDPEYLRPGKTLQTGRYLVGRLARKNGESAVYVGYDNQDKHTCWIREYFPTKLSRRVRSKGLLTPLDGSEAQYKALLSDFIDVCNEVKRLGVTESVIPILSTFAENNTVYAIYEHLGLIRFDLYLEKNGGKLPTKTALNLMLPFFNMVATIHDHGHIHRGISPHTVYVDKNGQLYLWDFSVAAARTASSEIDAELFNGYSAPEQYSPSGWQGTWTDIYAMAALFYRAVSGFVPPKSTFVGEERHMAPLVDLVVDMPANVSEAVEEAMKPAAETRTQAVYSFTSRLLEGEGTRTAVYDTSKTRPPEPPVRPKDSGGFKYAILALAVTVLLLVSGVWYVMTKYFPNMMNEDDKKTPTHSLEEIGIDSGEETSESGDIDDIDTPRFVGQMLSVIQGDVEYNGNFVFKVEEEFNEEFPEGVVFKQSPIADTTIAKGSTVTLYVSKGGDDILIMPNIIGLDYGEALQLLTGQNIPCEKIDRYATGAVAGSVVGTSPAPGTKINTKTDHIIVYVMPGTAPGQSEANSQTADESASGSSSSKTESSKSSSSGSSSSKSSSSGSSSSKSSSSSKTSSSGSSSSKSSSSSKTSSSGSSSSKS